MLWGWFAASATGAFKKVNGIMKEEEYLKIFFEEKNLARQWIIGHRWAFQQDNNPKYTYTEFCEEMAKLD